MIAVALVKGGAKAAASGSAEAQRIPEYLHQGLAATKSSAFLDGRATKPRARRGGQELLPLAYLRN
jgi:hypothetical protein